MLRKQQKTLGGYFSLLHPVVLSGEDVTAETTESIASKLCSMIKISTGAKSAIYDWFVAVARANSERHSSRTTSARKVSFRSTTPGSFYGDNRSTSPRRKSAAFCLLSFIHSQHLEYSDFYRAMHYSAKCGLAIACRLSVCLSVRLWRWWIMTT